MIKRVLGPLYLVLATVAYGVTIDTLDDTTQIDDAIIYNYVDCTSEVSGEDCRRFNGGHVINFGIGNIAVGAGRRALFAFPGWNGELPDSAKFEIYCFGEVDTQDRKFFLYPLTQPFLEGSEASYGVGDYPDPDSGVTWNHAWLDIGDADSLSWTSAGSDFDTSVACTTTVTGINQYFVFAHFERILHYFDSTGHNYGIVCINENAFPSNGTAKLFKSSEAGLSLAPRLILYQAFTSTLPMRRRHILTTNPD